MNSKPNKFDQIGIIVKDIENSAEFINGVFNFPSDLRIVEQQSTVIYKEQEVSFKMKKIMQNLGEIQFEIVQVIESTGDHLYLDFIKGGNEGLHHLGIYEKNSEDLIHHFKKTFNIEVIQSGIAGKVKFYFLDTRKLMGFYLELISF